MGARLRELLRRRQRGGAPLLYALLDDGLVAAPDLVSEARALAAGAVDVVQLRCKQLDDKELCRIAKAVHEVLAAVGIPLILNDRVDLARACAVEGVHLGASDLPAAAARRVLGPTPCIGVTVHDALEVAAAPADADYLGCGAVFPTSTRPNSSVCGPAALTRLAAGTSLPMIAIGGLGPENVGALREASVAGVAVGSAVSPAREKGRELATLRQILDAWSDSAPPSPV